MIGARKAVAPAVLLASAWLLLAPGPLALAQGTGAPDSTSAPAVADSTRAPAPAAAPAPSSQQAPETAPARSRVTSTFRYVPEDRDRWEIGAGPVQGFFNILGGVSYRRWVGQGPVFEQNLMLEVTGSAKKQLTEGAFGVYLLMRPSFTYRDSWRLRPLVEFGPSAHAVVQVASLEGLSRTLYKSEVYLKTHGYAGFEALLSPKVGFLVRGRMSIPSHRPMDYAQAAIFLR